MNFQVEWLDSALNDLTALWLAADSAIRAAVTHHVRQIEQRLATDPIGNSESRFAGRRILIDDLLACSFRVKKDRVVSIVHIWRIDGRRH